MSLDFGNVNSANSEVRESSFKVVKPGLQTLMIAEVNPTVSARQTPGLVVKFDSKEHEASFNHTFWLSGGALPRVQYLVEKFTGAKLTDSFSGEGLDLATSVAAKLSSKLVGLSKTVIVDGEIRNREKDGKVYTNTYPELRFAGFVDPQGQDAEPRIKDNTVTVNTITASSLATEVSSDDDLPF